MTATWALIFMICYRSCEPQYAINYNSRGECVRAIPKQESWASRERYACVPISKD